MYLLGSVEELLEEIRQNSPNSHRLNLKMSNADVRASIAGFNEALLGNSFVNELHVFASPSNLVPPFNVDSLLHTIQRRNQLEDLGWDSINSYKYSDMRDGLEESISRKHFIHTLAMSYVSFSVGGFSSVVRPSTSIRNLDLEGCVIDGRETNLDAIASCFQNNASIVNLNLAQMDEKYCIPILTGLALSTASKLEKLTLLSSIPSVQMCNALQSLLLSTTTSPFRTLCLISCYFSGETFEPLSRGIRHSTNATSIIFEGCRFDLASTCLLGDAFQSPSSNGKVNSLGICDGRWSHSNERSTFYKPIGIVLTNITGQSTSTLRKLRLTENFCKNCQPKEVAAIMEAVMLSPTLECLQIDKVDTVGKCTAIAAILPKLSSLKLFRFGVTATLSENLDVKRLFLQAFQKNASLEIILVNRHSLSFFAANGNYFDNDEMERLAKYATRNKKLPLLIESPCSISVQLWPRMFEILRGCACWHEPDIVYRILVSLGGSVGRYATQK
jgi:hypothetical protein